MIRRVQLSTKYANEGKQQSLNLVLIEAKRVVNLYIDYLWKIKDFQSKFVPVKVDTWLSARLQQCLGKQALEIVKSQRKRKKKIKPTFNKKTINLDSRFADIEFDKNSFDVWIKLSSIGSQIKINIPSKKHKHFHNFKDWNLKKSIRLRDGFIDLYFEKKEPIKKKMGKVFGVDIGCQLPLS